MIMNILNFIFAIVGVISGITMFVSPVFLIWGIIQLIIAKEDAKKKYATKKIIWSISLFIGALVLTIIIGVVSALVNVGTRIP